MNHIGTVPMRTRPISYQPLRAGQFRGYGGCNVFPSRTTIVNNNIYGGYGYDSGCCGYNDGGMSKGMKWMMGLGVALPFLGSILSAFGFGGDGGRQVEDGQGGEQPPANDQSDLIKDLTKQVENLTATVEDLKNGKPEAAPIAAAAASAAPAEEVEPKDEDDGKIKIDFSNVKDGADISCTDLSSKTKDISGKLSNVKTNAEGVPTSFTITDTSINKNGNTYEYVLDTIADDGTPSYKCVKKNNQAVIGEHSYAFKDGKLVQENNGFKGFGVGVKTAAETLKPPVNNEVPEGTMKDEVSNKYSSLTPYFNKKDGKWHSTPDQDHSYNAEWFRFNNTKSANTATNTASASNTGTKKLHDIKVEHQKGTGIYTYYIDGKKANNDYEVIAARKENEQIKKEQEKLNSPLPATMEKQYSSLIAKVNSNSNLTPEQKTEILNRIATAKNNSKTQGSFWNSNGLNFYNKITQELMNENIV